MNPAQLPENVDNSFTRKFGFPKERTAGKVVGYLRDSHIAFIKQSPFAVIATANSQGECDASPKGGLPGFIKVLDKERLLLPDVAGNKLFQSYQNIEMNPHIGLIFFIPGLNETLRINGKAKILSGEEVEKRNLSLEVATADDNSKILQGVLVEVQEAYGHCPRAFSFSKLWDVKNIQENNSKSCTLN